MPTKIIFLSIEKKEIVLGLAIVLFIVGLWSFFHLPIDAVPDLSNVQVQINTYVPAFAPEEVEKLITFPIEIEMGGIPGLETIRSLSKFGLSQVTLIFRDGTDVYRSRQLVGERLLVASSKIPPNITPTMAPIATGLGEIFNYIIRYKEGADKPSSELLQLIELRLLQEYTIRPMLRRVAGVADVNTSGGYQKLILVEPDPSRLTNVGLTIGEFGHIVGQNTEIAGGGVIDKAGEQLTVRSLGRVNTLDEIAIIPIKYAGGSQPVLVRDVAKVEVGGNIRVGAATYNGAEAVLGTVMMLIKENSRAVSERVSKQLELIQQRIPSSFEIVPVYNRAEVVNATIRTVTHNLTEGALLVTAIIFVLLGNWRSSLLIASVIPMSFLFAITLMCWLGLSGNLMSLGAIDFGLIVDGAVVVTENVLRRLSVKEALLARPISPEEKRKEIFDATLQVIGSVFFGILIITVVYLPILTLSGIEGKTFRPMAITVIFILSGSLLLSLTYVPTVAVLGLKAQKEMKDTFVVSVLKKAYLLVLHWTLASGKWIVLPAALLLIASAFIAFSRLGTEFIPRLDEGSIAAMIYRAWSSDLPSSVAMEKKTEKMLLEKFPEIKCIFSRVGTSEIATDPMPPNENDIYLMLKPKDMWRKKNGKPISKAELIELINKEISYRVPGQKVLFSQPIETRFNEMLEGVRTDLSIKWFGEDYDILTNLAKQTEAIVKSIPGTLETQIQAEGDAPSLEFIPDRQLMAKYNIEASEMNSAIYSAMAGNPVGLMIDGEKRYPITIRLPEHFRENPEEVLNLPIKSVTGGVMPLSSICHYQIYKRPRSIFRENGVRYRAVMVTFTKKDIEGYVEEIRKKVEKQIHPPKGYYVEYAGQYQNLIKARQRLFVIVPSCLLLIFFLSYIALKNFKQSLLVISSVPFAATGGILSLFFLHIPFSISAAIGMIALSGISVLASLILVTFINQLRQEGYELKEAIERSCDLRFRPILTTAAVASLGFIPMALSKGAGAEVQKPLAIVVIGGIGSSTFLTLLLLPLLYFYLEYRKEKKQVHPILKEQEFLEKK
ncbi:CusA/CzcA family heavy metal efflux RND transporter [Candidatus Methylacidiphilum fumarolicum]|uniref:Cation efflux system protein CzcA n=2 Tax=Candidatus Methylacidiphilum fumarolicum TaxID=591154 RepID=A0ABN8XDR6_9BACT|nr:CusA/CzcA family heavy metal efflux RND transporter [Candidatus Methylacidiphilum fumarolicum]MBW6415853.1 CusA/CzcA family heavy metal efflux RND transporter [Candidatus Methylacidiphilum fumarolicum]TFE67673.1 cation transporter [Candidatus Methylacidiphilum fumarolicum]TFE72422.1 CusA/CzcA family heavy metal efflux RND transporter [Candidatus Methylacidiphilum fumarolicum]TFE72440.1 CusA/CzcA family heavy metal efflux RND transporter [Candidatus Methylacidiphilum fumarolicum]TFE77797.1 c